MPRSNQLKKVFLAMMLCHCRAFNEKAVRDHIESNAPAKAEDIHHALADKPPNCGTCLQVIEAMRLHFEQQGKAPHPNDINNRHLRQAAQSLGKRYHEEHKSDSPGTSAPCFKRPYIVRHLKGRDNSPA